MNPIQKIFKDCSDKDEMEDFDMAIPLDGLSLCFSKTCGSKPEGYPVDDDKKFRFMTLVGRCTFNPTLVGAGQH